MKVLITGASGFVGGALCHTLQKTSQHQVLAGVRRPGSAVHNQYLLPALGSGAPIPDLNGIDVIVHCAARVHVGKDTSRDPLGEYRRINLTGTLEIAQRAAADGVRRFVFISSIKVNGEGTEPGRPYTSMELPHPVDPYGISKLEAEEALQALAADTGMELVIIRPVLVYGPGVKANFRSMMKWVHKGIPLPLGALHNKRSLVALDNLVDLIMTCIDHPAAPGQTFLATDGEDLTMTELLHCLASSLHTPARLLPVPAAVLNGVAAALGKQEVAQKICGTLQADISHTRQTLGWKPPLTVTQALHKTAEAYLRDH